MSRAGAEPTARGETRAVCFLEDILARAYELFESRGCEHGHDLEDWLRADAELRAR